MVIRAALKAHSWAVRAFLLGRNHRLQLAEGDHIGIGQVEKTGVVVAPKDDLKGTGLNRRLRPMIGKAVPRLMMFASARKRSPIPPQFRFAS
jgi:hypothetical protein